MVLLLRAEAYQLEIQLRFEKLVERIRAEIGDFRVEHIGASAIPGADSKGDLDICVLVPAVCFGAVLEQFKGLGYGEHAGTLRTPALCMLDAPPGWPDHAVQVVAEGSEFEGFLNFRDALRHDPNWLAEYNRVKRAAAHLPEEAYRARKAAFIEHVLERTRNKL